MTEPTSEPSVRPGFWGWIVAGLVLLAIAAVLLPDHHHQRGTRNTTRALQALKAISISQTLFRESDKDGDGTLDYGTLEELSNATLIDGDLGSGRKQGYVFQVRPSPQTPGLLWMAVASPAEPTVTGDRYFVTNQAGVIFYTGLQGHAFELNDACEIPPNAVHVGK